MINPDTNNIKFIDFGLSIKNDKQTIYDDFMNDYFCLNLVIDILKMYVL